MHYLTPFMCGNQTNRYTTINNITNANVGITQFLNNQFDLENKRESKPKGP